MNESECSNLLCLLDEGSLSVSFFLFGLDCSKHSSLASCQLFLEQNLLDTPALCLYEVCPKDGMPTSVSLLFSRSEQTEGRNQSTRKEIKK